MYNPKITVKYSSADGADPATICTNAAAITHGKAIYYGDKQKLCHKLYISGHHSAFEFAHFTILFENVSRAFLAQIRTHRHLSFMSSSQHYEDYRNYPIICDDEAIYDVSKSAFNAYTEALNNIPKWEARMCLPNSAGVRVLISGNARAWADVLRLRLCNRNVPEMVIAMRMVHKELTGLFPELFRLVGPNCEDAFMKECRDNNACGRV